MDDTISRLAVIQIIEKMRARIGHNLERAVGGAMIEILDEVGEDVGKLPSALGTNLAQLGTDCISRQSAIDALRKLREEDIEDYGCEIPEGFNQDHLDRATFAIKQLPPIQSKLLQPWEVLAAQAVLPQPAEPKRGKWIEDKGQQTLMQNFIERGEVWRVCSVCGAGHMIGYKYAIDKAYHDRHHNFCPNCGADMRGKQDE